MDYSAFYIVSFYEIQEQTIKKKVLVFDVFVFRLKKMVLSKNVSKTTWNVLRLVFISVCDVLNICEFHPF